jgi:succinyl-CoA synthetase beta subunit
MVKLLEYQGKDVLRRFGVPTPAGQVARSVEQALAAAEAIGLPVVVKAQIYAGKRGKSGGIRTARDAAELAAAASEMLGSLVRGHRVEAVLVEQQVRPDTELYVGVVADPRARMPVLLVCAEGGIDVEEIAATRPESLFKAPVDVVHGVYLHDALNLLRDVPGLTSAQKLEVARVLERLYTAYRQHDCRLIEVNPLALVGGKAVALDARVELDGDALSRQANVGIDHAEEAGDRSATLLEQIAATIDEGDHRGTVHFVQIDPDLSYIREHGLIPIGFDCVGAGVSLTLMDELVPLGFYPVNFCDSSGNPVGSKLYRITKVIFSQPGIQGYVFASCVSSQQLDNTARGIIKALKELYPATGGQPNIPTVLCFRGAWDVDALRLLDEHGISAGHWVRVLGRDTTEKEVASAFRALYDEWQAVQGVAP